MRSRLFWLEGESQLVTGFQLKRLVARLRPGSLVKISWKLCRESLSDPTFSLSSSLDFALVSRPFCQGWSSTTSENLSEAEIIVHCLLSRQSFTRNWATTTDPWEQRDFVLPRLTFLPFDNWKLVADFYRGGLKREWTERRTCGKIYTQNNFSIKVTEIVWKLKVKASWLL